MNKRDETYSFEAETSQLLELMISAVYSSKEVFLRELISNASDALDKLRFEALTDTSLTEGVGDREIRLETDSDARVLKVHDNGIGMSREEVRTNIGTIAKSGTKDLLKKLKEQSVSEVPSDLIGQFGVGFYSCFMVAKRVEIDTRRAGEEESTHWEAEQGSTYTLSKGSRTAPGTTVTLHLRDVDEENGLEDYTQAWVLRRIVKDYSDFVRYPIKLMKEKETEEDGKKQVTVEDQILNSQKAIWLKPKGEVTDEEFNEFYKHLCHDVTAPLTRVSMQAEGRIEYRALAFIPSRAPMDLFFRGYERGLQLYVKNIKILDRCEDLMPDFLRFVKGVVDSPDMPLNVSREMLQFSRQTAQIRSALTKKILDALVRTMKEERDAYTDFFQELGTVLKEGVASHPESKEKIVELMLFQSSADAEKLTSLEEYVSRMKENQTEIYYLAGESRKAIEGSPHLEAAKSRGLEVLYMVDPVDELILPYLPEFKGKTLKSVGKGELALGSEEEQQQAKKSLEDKTKSFDPFLKALQKELDDYVSEVRLTSRLTTSAACLVGTEASFSPHVERLMAKNNIDMPKQKRILELNPEHEIVEKLKARFDVRPTDLDLADHAFLLFGQARLAEGAAPEEPAKLAGLLADLMARAL
jgi:molecular chaperone HtpG